MKSNEQTIKEILGSFVKSKPIKDKYIMTRLKELWKSCLGKTIDGYTTDLRFHQGTLTVVVTSAPLRQELLFGQDKLKQLLNEALGEDLVKEIRVF